MTEEENTLASSAGDDAPQLEAEDATAEENADEESSQEDQDEAATAESSETESKSAKESDQSDDEPDNKEETEKKPSRKERRFDQLTAKRREAERRAESAEARAKRAEERLAKYESPAPRESDFDSYDEYEAARAAYQSRQVLKQDREADAEEAKEEAKTARQEADAALQEAFTEASAEFAARVPDYEEKVFGDGSLPITPAMKSEIFASEKGPEVAYYLANNRDEARQIAALKSQGEVARAIGRIEGRLTLPEPKKVTQAPKPIKTVATGSGSRSGFDPFKASDDEFEAHLKAKGVIG